MFCKNTFLTEHRPLADFPISFYFLLELKKVDVRFKKKKMKFYKETLKITSNIVQNQEQVAVSSIASVVKPSTSSHILHEFHEIKLNLMKYALNCVSGNSLKEIFHSVSSPTLFFVKQTLNVFHQTSKIKHLHLIAVFVFGQLGYNGCLINLCLIYNFYWITTRLRQTKQTLTQAMTWNCIWI